MKARILVIDDELAIRESLRMILEYDGYECLLAPTGQEGIALVERETPDLVFLDIKMPGMDGLETLRRIRDLDEILPIVIISGHGTVSTAVEATKLGAFDFLEKPLASERVSVTIRNALDQHRLQDENRSWRQAADVRHEMVGQSPAIQQITEAVGAGGAHQRDGAPAGSERGREGIGRARDPQEQSSGARAVRPGQLRRDSGRLDRIGAVRSREGVVHGCHRTADRKFEQADRGTLFLDEVGDMSLRAQAKVLRVLQEGEVERLGSARTIKVNVRVVAATNKDLTAEMEKGRFRDDLYFRLSVVPIPVPPLRDRAEDIPELVRHFVTLFARENNFKTRGFTEAALDLMKRHQWKGNIRELRNLVERLIIMTPGDAIDAPDVGATLGVDDRATSADNSRERPGTLREFKEDAERTFLVGMLREHGWNISKTAEVIDTPRSNLYKKLEQYRIRQETDG